MKRYNIPEENFYAIYACNKHVDETIFFGAFKNESFANDIVASLKLDKNFIGQSFLVKAINYTQLKEEIGSWRK